MAGNETDWGAEEKHCSYRDCTVASVGEHTHTNNGSYLNANLKNKLLIAA